MTGNVRQLRPTGPLGCSTTEIADHLDLDPAGLAKRLTDLSDLLGELGISTRTRSGRHRRFSDTETVLVAALSDLTGRLHPDARAEVLRALRVTRDGAEVIAVDLSDRLMIDYYPRWDLPERIRAARTA